MKGALRERVERGAGCGGRGRLPWRRKLLADGKAVGAWHPDAGV